MIRKVFEIFIKNKNNIINVVVENELCAVLIICINNNYLLNFYNYVSHNGPI